MLVEKKFYFISLPRCASTSFMASCVKYNLHLQHVNEQFDIQTQLNRRNKKLSDVSYKNFQHQFAHSHESIEALLKKFGNGYDIISIKRDKYERFISLWNHILHEMHLNENPSIFKICYNLGLDEILFYNSNDLLNDELIDGAVNRFIEKHNLEKITTYGRNMIEILMNPYSKYHNHNKNIIWFDFNKLNELEEWVSKKLNIKFKLLKINSSNHYKSKLILNDKFKTKYNMIYTVFDELKNNKTII